MPRTAHRGKPIASPNAGRRFPPEVLSDAEVRALLDACGDGSPTHARNRALIAVLYRGGLRVSEALALYPKDLDPSTGAVRVLWGKGVGPGRSGWTRGRSDLWQSGCASAQI